MEFFLLGDSLEANIKISNISIISQQYSFTFLDLKEGRGEAENLKINLDNIAVSHVFFILETGNFSLSNTLIRYFCCFGCICLLETKIKNCYRLSFMFNARILINNKIFSQIFLFCFVYFIYLYSFIPFFILAIHVYHNSLKFIFPHYFCQI